MSAHFDEYTGTEIELIFDSCAPKEGGIGVGTIDAMAKAGGWKDSLAQVPMPPPDRLFAKFVEAPERKDARWQFITHDAVADAALPPITYRDENKLWPDSQERTVTQVIAGAKCHKTNWVMSEMFRLMMTGSARVVMLALEGAYGVRTARLKAQALHHSYLLADLKGRFQIAAVASGSMFDLSDAECVGAFAAWLNGDWTDVVIDTQHRAAGTLEENSATDARTLWNAVEFIFDHKHDIAITGDTYTAHQFGGSAGAGLTAAQCNTLFHGASGLNAAITDFLTAQTDANTAKTATATAKVATAAALAAAAIPNDMTLLMDLAAAPTTNDVVLVLEAFRRRMEAAGSHDIGNI